MYKNIQMTILFLIGVTGFLMLPLMSKTIVNTEKLSVYAQKDNLAGLELNFNIEKGNSNIASIDGMTFLFFEKGRQTIKLVTGWEYLSEEQDDIIERHFLQLRHNYFLGSGFRIFSFYQIQRNKSLLLKRRQLAGAGLRKIFSPFDSLKIDAGTGLMIENEHLDIHKISSNEKTEQVTYRMANVMTMLYKFQSQLSFINSTFIQPDVENFKDFRFFNESTFLFSVKKYFSLSTTFIWLYDSHPPGELKKSDFNLKSGIVIQF